MKKFLLIALVAGIAVIVAREAASEREERKLWREITDPLEG
ncbi:DLW-39 family protein [Serinibacter salmoneus]|uniref:Uncharacterized protein n=1 Tax=Serinibacter salmoneus TaxID=556530 RepID=A0A2A9D5B0_9MICO|nr:DLW-39 family protein [Serinibacter salmoneus]PFG21142.1 hypothetical protein ATL40_2764 [Serinibacter salmoneus]